MSRLGVLAGLAFLPLLFLPHEAQAGRDLHLISEIINNDPGTALTLSGDEILRWLMTMLGLL